MVTLFDWPYMYLHSVDTPKYGTIVVRLSAANWGKWGVLRNT